ncbi:21050_t:CDS:2 [Cetraspora pellucida]|uniref:21050_t:CDS:1 n=1 Tax=Cetraspora pellucida TaxID=1433469 RepID=A0A9N9AWH1_9GLOM|nr:21050_t:CDS:2 [Cetraspora pellucida]
MGPSVCTSKETINVEVPKLKVHRKEEAEGLDLGNLGRKRLGSLTEGAFQGLDMDLNM